MCKQLELRVNASVDKRCLAHTGNLGVLKEMAQHTLLAAACLKYCLLNSGFLEHKTF